MKILTSFILCSLFIATACPLNAQNNDPFATGGNSGTLKVDDSNQILPPERTIRPERKQATKMEAPKEESGVTIINPSKDIKVEFISCIGNIADQTFVLTIKVTNLQTNRTIQLNQLTAFDSDGTENHAYGTYWEALTDIAVKKSFKFKDRVLPNKIQKLAVIKLPFQGFGAVEFRNVKINWQ